METVRSEWENRADKDRGEIHIRLMISDIQDQQTPGGSADAFYLGESEHILWFFEKIRQYQGCSALQGANFQRWKLYKICNGSYHLLCKDRWDDILIAKLIRKKFPFNELSVIYTV